MPNLAARLRTRFGLTPAEIRVAIILADGLTYAEIAERLSISTHTVHTHVKEIHQKLESTRTGARRPSSAASNIRNEGVGAYPVSGDAAVNGRWSRPLHREKRNVDVLRGRRQPVPCLNGSGRRPALPGQLLEGSS